MGIYEGLKDAAGILKEAGKIEQYQQILDAQEKLFEMQKKIVDLEVDNKKLKEQFEIKGKLVPEDNMYWIEEDGKRDGPFCTCCWDSEYKPIRLHINKDFDSAECPKCKTKARSGKAIIIPSRNSWRNSSR